MKYLASLLTAVSLVAFGGFAQADDHLYQAQQHGLKDNTHSQAATTNPAGHSGDLAPGQGSPFTGCDVQTPATDTTAANDHAQTKVRGEPAEGCEEE